MKIIKIKAACLTMIRLFIYVFDYFINIFYDFIEVFCDFVSTIIKCLLKLIEIFNKYIITKNYDKIKQIYINRIEDIIYNNYNDPMINHYIFLKTLSCYTNKQQSVFLKLSDLYIEELIGLYDYIISKHKLHKINSYEKCVIKHSENKMDLIELLNLNKPDTIKKMQSNNIDIWEELKKY